MNSQINQILDVSWKYCVSIASDKPDEGPKSYLQLDLHITDSHGPKHVYTEMTMNEFYKFLHDLETAKNNQDLL